MAKVIGPLRIARSFVTPTGAANEVARVLDFQLGSDQGIEINWVLGYGQFYDASPTPSDTVPAHSFAHQTLHLETGETEDLPDDEAEDADDIDSEIFYVQSYASMFIVGNTVTFGAGGSVQVLPAGRVDYQRGELQTARNIIHKATTVEADTFLNAGVLIGYHYLKLSSNELGSILQRR